MSVVSRHSFGVLLRVSCAAFLGYLATAETAVLAAWILPLEPMSAVLTSMLLSFLLYSGCIMWAFHVRQHWRALTDLGGLWLLALLVNNAMVGGAG